MPHAFAQHKMMPPAANIGTKKVTLNFQTGSKYKTKHKTCYS